MQSKAEQGTVSFHQQCCQHGCVSVTQTQNPGCLRQPAGPSVVVGVRTHGELRWAGPWM